MFKFFFWAMMGGSITALNDVTIVCDGNSITRGVASNPGGKSYPTLLSETDWAVNIDSFAIFNFGGDGQTTGQMQSDAANQVDDLFRPERKNVVIAWEVSNDVYLYQYARTCVDRFWAYCDARRARGWQVIGMTVLPRTQTPAWGTSAAYSNKLDSANLLLLTEWENHCDLMLDVRTLDEFSTQTPPPALMPDGVHPNEAGYIILVNELILPALQSFNFNQLSNTYLQNTLGIEDLEEITGLSIGRLNSYTSTGSNLLNPVDSLAAGQDGYFYTTCGANTSDNWIGLDVSDGQGIANVDYGAFFWGFASSYRGIQNGSGIPFIGNWAQGHILRLGREGGNIKAAYSTNNGNTWQELYDFGPNLGVLYVTFGCQAAGRILINPRRNNLE